MRLTLRQKLFVAFALVAALGGAGGMIGLWRMDQLARIYQREQDEVAIHEEVHDHRLLLYELSSLVHRRPARAEEEQRARLDRSLEKLQQAGQRCTACHADDPRQAGFLRSVVALSTQARALLAGGDEVAVGALAMQIAAIDASVVDAHGVLARMEQHYHDLLERRRASGRTLVEPLRRELLLLVAGSLLLAVVLAALLARALSRPILPLIAAARRLGAGERGPRVELPRDRDLAAVAKALNEMATKVAEGARADMQGQLLERTLRSQEDERRRLARELHDELGQSLSALLLTVQGLPPGVEPAIREALEQRARGLVDEVRRLAWDLRPSILDDYGVERALARHCQEVAARRGLPVDCESVGFEDGQRLPERVEVVLYRVAQEAIQNAVRHARASRLSVVLVRRPHEVTLLVEDDGQGFARECLDTRARGSLGLAGMQERVSLVGGALDVNSSPGQGCSVRARVPLDGGAA